MVRREEFDDRLRAAAVAAGAQVRERVAVRAIEQDPEGVRLRLADGTTIAARAVIGADGSSGVTARHVGVRYRQVDLGLELEIAGAARRAGAVAGSAAAGLGRRCRARTPGSFPRVTG